MMQLKDVCPGTTIKIKMIEGIADAYVINNVPESKKIALRVLGNTFGHKQFRDWENVFDYNDRSLEDFDILNNIRPVIGNRPPQ